MDDEHTSNIILDTVDYTPNLFFGFTASELAMCYIVSLIITTIPLSIISGIFTKTSLYGIVAGAFFAGFISFFAAQKARVLKKDRPSYMLWMDLARFIQDKGIFGIKVKMGLVRDQVWEIQRTEKK